MLLLNLIFEYQFLQNALIAGLLTSIVCGIIGVIIVEKKLVMMSGGIAHTAYGGVGLGYLLGIEPIIGALGFAVVSACGIGAVRRRGGASAEVIIAMLWSFGMALGILFIGVMPGYPPDINSYLFGNILSVTKSDILMEIIICLAVMLVICIFYNDWKAYLFDEEFSFILGLKTKLLEYTLLIMTAMAVVVLIKVVGIVLILALLTAPAATSALLSKRLGARMLISVILGCVYCFFGLWLSYDFNIPSGSTVIILSVLCYFIVYFAKSVFQRKKHIVYK